jgi:hypothetical protein
MAQHQVVGVDIRIVAGLLSERQISWWRQSNRVAVIATNYGPATFSFPSALYTPA